MLVFQISSTRGKRLLEKNKKQKTNKQTNKQTNGLTVLLPTPGWYLKNLKLFSIRVKTNI